MPHDASFHYDLEHSQDGAGWKTVTIHCHGRLITEDTPRLRELVQPLIAEGGHIVLDFGDLEYLDSSGLGALVGLKVSAINKGFCKLDLLNLTPRVKKLLSITNLTQLFAE